MSDIESTDWSELAANNIQPAPAGWPANSSPMIVYSNGREDMGAIKRDWNRRNPTVTSGGSANAQTLTYAQGPTAYVQGQTYTFIVGFTNTSATTLNVSGLGAKNVVFVVGVSLTGGELVAGAVIQVVYDGTRFLILGASSGSYLPLSGGGLTGPLSGTVATFNSFVISNSAGTARSIIGRTATSNRWQMQLGNNSPEGGSNAGSNFEIDRYTDAGAFIDTPLTINRANGTTTIGQGLTVGGTGAGASGPTVFINGVAGTTRQVSGETSGVLRWQIILGTQVAEGGSNAGSDFQLNRYNDAGGSLGSCISAVRSTGTVTFQVAIVNGPSDRTLKENIAPLTGALDKVQQLQGVSFDFIKDPAKRRQLGLIAQDVAPIVPEVIQDYIQPDEPPALAIDYTRLVPLLVEAIKELTAKVVRLEAGLAAASQA